MVYDTSSSNFNTFGPDEGHWPGGHSISHKRDIPDFLYGYYIDPEVVVLPIFYHADGIPATNR